MNPIQLAANQQQQPQVQQPDQQTPSPIALANQQITQRGQQINQEEDVSKNEQQNAIASASKAMSTLNPGASSGDSTSNTMSKVGQAINPSTQWANMCEAFAEKQIYGKTGMYPNAYSAYQANAQAGNIKTSTDNIPANAQVFMAPDNSNGMNGHTGVMQKNGKFLAPLSNGSIEEFSIPEWEKFSGQRFIGWSSPSK